MEGKNEDEKKQLTNLTPLRAFLARKDVVKNEVKKCRRDNFLFKNAVSTAQSRARNNFNWRHSKSRRPIHVWDNTCSIKTFFEINKGSLKYDTEKQSALRGLGVNNSESIRRVKNIGENLPGQCEDWMERECGIKKQTIYNYKNLYKLMKIAPKLMNCRVNMAYFVQYHEILMNYFEEHDERWKHNVYL